MFYQEALPKVRFLSCVDSLLTIRDRQWRKLAAMFEKPTQQIHFRLCGNGCLFLYGCFDVVAVIKMGAYIHGVLILCGCLLSRFHGMSILGQIGMGLVLIRTGNCWTLINAMWCYCHLAIVF